MLSALTILFLPPNVDLDVVYSRPAGFELMMDIYRPEPSVATKAAVIVIHGGAWIGGSKSDVKPIAQALAKQGLLAASVQYRLAPKTRWPGFYDDVQTAVRYLRENSAKLGLDPNRIGSCGASAGGHLALLLAFTETRDAMATEYNSHSSRVRAVFDIFGPTDMSRDYPPSYDMLFSTILGKPKAQAASEIRAASPINFIDKLTSPVFILHGTADPVVPIAQSKWLEEKLKLNGTQVVARYIDGMKHELPQTNQSVMKAMQEGLAWLKTSLLK